LSLIMSTAAKNPKELMEYRHLGRTGLKVSLLSFGAWVTFGDQVDIEEAYQCMKIAYDNGCNFFDNAEVYADGKAEIVMGQVLKRMFEKDGIQRSDVVISTKLFWGTPYYHAQANKVNLKGLSRKRLYEGIKGSLKRLELDYVDVIFAHRMDSHTPMDEIVRGFNWIINQGYALYWGTSEWSAEEIREACEVANKLNLIGPCAEQPQYNMLHRTRFEFEYARLYQPPISYGTTIWSPLASGLLSGKYSNKQFQGQDNRLGQQGGAWLREKLESGEGMNGLEEKNVDRIMEIIENLKPIAEKLGVTLAQLALAWAAKNPNVSTVITGASRSSQVAENFKTLAVIPKLTPDVMEEIEKVLKNKPKQPTDWTTMN
jgi:voltage-dependent potassium channel beta subunit